ncbi:2Fe-2S iron-sulfur cluster-binding protein [Rheinheimera sp. WS51]|uniref:2Fe-2S iron-sulfur cluster-binding protein n=1 Tax=Rheinheimera sp. WS51 TaxID=3425886 RepID=UPI003D93C53B
MSMVKKIHKWSSVIVGIQLMVWLGSGMYFNFMDHTKAAGNTYKSNKITAVDWQQLKLKGLELKEPKMVLQQQLASNSLALIELVGKPYYLLNHQRGLYDNFVNKHSVVDAITGEPVIIDNSFAESLAAQSYTGPGQIVSTTLMQPPIADLLKQKNAVWQVNYSDDINTSVYIEADSGRIAGHSDDDKRLADFFLKLHFMDYANEGSFNNEFMMFFAFLTLFLSGTGLIWTIDLALRGQYKIKWFARKTTVKLFDSNQKSMGQLAFSNHKNLLDGLVDHKIILPSTCGGGGTCGRCRIMINQNVKSTAADVQHFSVQELEQGYRLACQHFCDDVEHMTLMDITDAKKYTLELTSSVYLSPYIKELRFKAHSKVPVQYKAGAFMRFFIPDSECHSIPADLPGELKPYWQHISPLDYQHSACSRSYSLASIDENTNELMFVIKLQSAGNPAVLPGIGSNYLGNLKVGEYIDALGPFEEFYAKSDSDKTMVLVGAGSGMAPLKSLIEEQLFLQSHNSIDKTIAKPAREIHFFYGARNENDIVYVDYFYELAKQYPHFYYYPVLSRPDKDWLGATGYAQHVLALNWQNIVAQGDPEFYLCGPKGLMDDTIRLLRDKGVPESDIAFDVFS